MSGWATEALVHEGLKEDEIKLLAKPFSVNELLEAVRVAIGKDAASA
jgi:FixJ family two-component response regulator